MYGSWQVAALQQARLVRARAEEAEAARRAKADEIARRKEQARVAKVLKSRLMHMRRCRDGDPPSRCQSGLAIVDSSCTP